MLEIRSICVFFFFSSRRRHTRSLRDWSSDVCSSDLGNNYFQTMQVQPQHGRVFTDSDGLAGTPIVVVNQSFAEKYWPGEEPLGKRLRVKEEQILGPWLTVVGVVPDILQNFRHHLQHDPLIYLPFAEQPARRVFLIARTQV